MGCVLPRVLAFCLCLTLRVGCLIIGYFSLALASVFLALFSVSLARVVKYVKNYEVGNTTDTQHSKEEIERQATNLYIIHGYFIAVLLYYAAINVLLLVGAHRKSPRCLRWHAKAGLALFVMAISMVIVSYVFVGIIAALPLLFWSVLVFYFLVVVRSTYLELEESDKTPPFEMNRLFIGQAYG